MPVGSRGLCDPFLWPAELLEHDEAARTEAALAQDIGEARRAAGARHVRDEPSPRL
jgi:hypothetical protein